MKVAIVGGSAQSTPALFDTDWALAAPEFAFELVGRSPNRLAAVARAVEMVAANRGRWVDCRPSSGPRADAIGRADVILIQFRIGGYAGRAWDETFPHRYGVCGDEGLGPGGLSSAWRTWPELYETLTTVSQTNPRALVILLTSPIGILTRCAREAFPSLRTYGICELPWTTLKGLCADAGVEPDYARYAYLAVNHLGWFSDVRVGDKRIVSGANIHPLKYVRLHDRPAEVLAEQQSTTPRAYALEELASDAFIVYKNGMPSDIVATLRRRQTPWYAQAVAPLLRSLAGEDTGVTYFLSAANDGYCSFLASDAVIEMPFFVRDGKIQQCTTLPWQREDIAAQISRLVAYEGLAARAVLDRDARGISGALRTHPWLDGIDVSGELVADVVAPVAAIRETSFI